MRCLYSTFYLLPSTFYIVRRAYSCRASPRTTVYAGYQSSTLDATVRVLIVSLRDAFHGPRVIYADRRFDYRAPNALPAVNLPCSRYTIYPFSFLAPTLQFLSLLSSVTNRPTVQPSDQPCYILFPTVSIYSPSHSLSLFLYHPLM